MKFRRRSIETAALRQIEVEEAVARLRSERIVRQACDLHEEFIRLMTLEKTPMSVYRDDVDDDCFPNCSAEIADIETRLTRLVTDHWDLVEHLAWARRFHQPRVAGSA